MIVEITDKMKQKAREWSNNVLDSSIKYHSNYTGISKEDRYYFGYLGELAFWKVLYQNNKEYQYEPKFDGLSDDRDFFIFIKGKKKKVDIKTASKGFYKNIMLPKKQWLKKKSDYYIGIRLEGDTANIFGYCKHSNFKEQNTFGDNMIVTMYKSLSELNPIETLLKKIDKAEK